MDLKNPKSDDINAEIQASAMRLKPLLREMVICISGAWGGLEQVAASDALDRGMRGLDVRVMCLQGTPIHEFLAHRKEVQVVPLYFRPRDYFDFKLKKELAWHIEDGVTLIHTHQPTLLGTISPWLWRYPRVALFATRHIMNNHNKRDFFHRMIYSRLDELLVMSETLKANVLATHPVREKHVKVVRLGLDFEKFDPATVDVKAQRAVWNANPDTIVVGLVGRIDPAKGQATFIRAAAGVLKNAAFENKVKFVIVGEETLGQTSSYLSELKTMVNQFRIGDHVVFTGYQKEIPQIMNALDILVMPSRQEAFGLVAIEAMAMETPIIISNGGSAREIVGASQGPHEEFGALVRPEDAFDLQKKLVELIQHPDWCRDMGKRARNHVLSLYDKRIRARDTLHLYEWALRKRSGLKRIL